MTDKISRELKTVEEERGSMLKDIDKMKESYARYLISDSKNINDYITHPHIITKKEIRKKKLSNFFNKVKKALGL